MHIAPTQDNNRSQHQNPKHPANVANRVALARVKSQFASQAMPAYHGAIARAHEANREHPNTTFFTPSQSRKAARMARHNDPLGFLGNKVEGFLQLKQIAQQGAQMFNPTTRTGLLNALSVFAGGPEGKGGFEVGGPKGDATPFMDSLGMRGQFRNYDRAKVNPLKRGSQFEGPNKGRPGAGIRGLVRRAEGVGGYRRANPLDVIEGKHMEQSNLRETRDMLKNYSNHQISRDSARAQAGDRTDKLMRLDELMNKRTIPYSPPEAFRLDASPEAFPSADMNAGKLNGLDNFVEYLAHYMDKGNDFHEGSMRAMHDLLFGGNLHIRPGMRIPRKP